MVPKRCVVCSECDLPWGLGDVTRQIAERIAARTGHWADDVALVPIAAWFAVAPSDERD